MLKIKTISIPLLAGALMFTARSEDDTSRTAQSRAAQPGAQSSARQSRELSENQRNRQSTFQPGEVSESQLKKTVTDVNKASSFIGMAVKNMQNENLGKVHDLVFDPESGKISYAVVSVGGFLGVGDKLIATPVTSLKPQPGQNYLTLNMDKSQVQSAPGLAQNNWPDLDFESLGASASSESGSSTGSGASSASSPAATSETPRTDSSVQGSSPSSASDSSQAQPQSSSTPASQGATPSSQTGSNSDSSQSSSSSSSDTELQSDSEKKSDQ